MLPTSIWIIMSKNHKHTPELIAIDFSHLYEFLWTHRLMGNIVGNKPLGTPTYVWGCVVINAFLRHIGAECVDDLHSGNIYGEKAGELHDAILRAHEKLQAIEDMCRL